MRSSYTTNELENILCNISKCEGQPQIQKGKKLNFINNSPHSTSTLKLSNDLFWIWISLEMQWPLLHLNICYNILYLLKFIEHPLPVCNASTDQTESCTHTCMDLAGCPGHVWGNINKEIEESRHKWGSTLLSLTIHFLIPKGGHGHQIISLPLSTGPE